MRSTFLLLFTVFFTIPALAQNSSRKIIGTPEFQPPPEAVESGLGGRVNVEVDVNKEGEVTTVKQVADPDWVCPDPKRLDAIAIQATARSLAAQVKFESTSAASTEWIGITFPSSKTDEPKAEERTAENGVTVRRRRPLPRMINGGIINGRAIRLPKPPYPPDARAARASGIANIKVQIDEDGSVFSAEPSSGHPLLLPAARRAACLATFSPTKLEGQPVKVAGVISYNFVP